MLDNIMRSARRKWKYALMSLVPYSFVWLCLAIYEELPRVKRFCFFLSGEVSFPEPAAVSHLLALHRRAQESSIGPARGNQN